MFKVRILFRWFLLMTVPLVLSFCSATGGVDPGGSGGNPGRRGNPCNTGVGRADRNAPIVCVDDTGGTLRVHPDPINTHSVGESTRQPVLLHWWTRSGGNALNIEIEPGCVTDVTCNGSHCTARTLPATERKQCKYDVWTDKHPRLDPDIIVDPCC